MLLAAALAASPMAAWAFDNGLEFSWPEKAVIGGAPQDSAGFLAGANYPWLNHGWDFGRNAWGHKGVSSAESRATVASDFAFMREKGVKAVRWFLFCDGRAAPEFDDKGRPAGFDDVFFADLDAALSIAQENGIKLILVLFNYELLDKARVDRGVQLGGHADWIAEPAKTEALFDKVLNPLLDRYGRHPAILAWEIMNEPEMRLARSLMILNSYKAVDQGAMQSFAKRVAAEAHARTGHLVTLGSLNRDKLPLWKGVGLDFYQYHYYDYMELGQPLDHRYDRLGLDKPCLLGEFPTEWTRRGIESYLELTRRNGFSGALPWSLRAGDRYSDFRGVADRFSAWFGK